MKKTEKKVSKLETHDIVHGTDRRKFLQMGALALAGTSLLLAGCNDDDLDSGIPPTMIPDLGSGNVGILNYAYALEQLEAAFYTEVVGGSYYASANAEEKQILQDTYEHEVIHRDFFKKAITGVAPDAVIPELEFDFSSVDFGNREQVLNTAVVLEDTGVKAYNGAGQLIDITATGGATYLLLAGKIVSVEARHASAFRNLVMPGSTNFASAEVLVDLADTGQAYDQAVLPLDILEAVSATGFFASSFTANNLPTA